MYSVSFAYQELQEIKKELENVNIPLKEIDVVYKRPDIEVQIQKMFPESHIWVEEDHVSLRLTPSDRFPEQIFVDPLSRNKIYIDTGFGNIIFHPDIDENKRVYKLDGLSNNPEWETIRSKVQTIMIRRGYQKVEKMS